MCPWRFLFPLLCLAALASGCLRPPQRETATPGKPTADIPKTAGWQKLDDLERLEYFRDGSPLSTATIYRFDPKQHRLRWLSRTAPLTLKEWQDIAPTAKLISNGVYFHEDFSPSGLLISEGMSIGKRRFDLDQSALISLAPSFDILDTSKERFQQTELTEAAQSYPLLFVDGKRSLVRDTGKFARRTFVGQDTEGRVYLGVVTNEAVTLYGLMELLEKTGIEWKEAVNLDGGPSTGLVSHVGEFRENLEAFTPVPNVLVVE